MKVCDGLGAKAWMRRTLEMLVTVIATITKCTVHTGRSKGTQSHRVQNLKGIIGEHGTVENPEETNARKGRGCVAAWVLQRIPGEELT